MGVNNRLHVLQISGLHGKSDVSELTDHLEDEVIDDGKYLNTVVMGFRT